MDLMPDALMAVLEPACEVVPTFAEAKAKLLARFEAAYCDAVLGRAHGNVALAARIAGMDKKNLHRKIRAHGLDPRVHKPQRPGMRGAGAPPGAEVPPSSHDLSGT